MLEVIKMENRTNELLKYAETKLEYAKKRLENAMLNESIGSLSYWNGYVAAIRDMMADGEKQ